MLRAAGAAIVDGPAPLVISEDALDAETGAAAAEALAAGETVLVLAQESARARWLPIGPNSPTSPPRGVRGPFLFTTEETAVPALPAATVLTTEPMSIVPNTVGPAWRP